MKTDRHWGGHCRRPAELGMLVIPFPENGQSLRKHRLLVFLLNLFGGGVRRGHGVPLKCLDLFPLLKSMVVNTNARA